MLHNFTSMTFPEYGSSIEGRRQNLMVRNNLLRITSRRGAANTLDTNFSKADHSLWEKRKIGSLSRSVSGKSDGSRAVPWSFSSSRWHKSEEIGAERKKIDLNQESGSWFICARSWAMLLSNTDGESNRKSPSGIDCFSFQSLIFFQCTPTPKQFNSFSNTPVVNSKRHTFLESSICNPIIGFVVFSRGTASEQKGSECKLILSVHLSIDWMNLDTFVELNCRYWRNMTTNFQLPSGGKQGSVELWLHYGRTGREI